MRTLDVIQIGFNGKEGFVGKLVGEYFGIIFYADDSEVKKIVTQIIVNSCLGQFLNMVQIDGLGSKKQARDWSYSTFEELKLVLKKSDDWDKAVNCVREGIKQCFCHIESGEHCLAITRPPFKELLEEAFKLAPGCGEGILRITEIKGELKVIFLQFETPKIGQVSLVM